MSRHDYIHRQRWLGWDDEARDAWTAWFADHDLSIDDIADFHVHQTTVAVNVYFRDEKGKWYAVRDPGGNMEVAQERIEFAHGGSHPPIPDAAGTRL